MVWRSQQQWVVNRAAQRWSVSWLGCWVNAFVLCDGVLVTQSILVFSKEWTDYGDYFLSL